MKNKTTVQNDKSETPLKKPDTIEADLQKEDNWDNLQSKSELEKRKNVRTTEAQSLIKIILDNSIKNKDHSSL